MAVVLQDAEAGGSASGAGLITTVVGPESNVYSDDGSGSAPVPQQNTDEHGGLPGTRDVHGQHHRLRIVASLPPVLSNDQ
jgi:hypothetical protein